MTTAQKIRQITKQAERDIWEELAEVVDDVAELDDHAEFNAEFERMRVETGPHLPLSLADYCTAEDLEHAAEYCDCCDRPLDEFGCCEHCFYLADMLGNL